MLPKLHRRHEDDSHYPVCKMSPGIPPGLFHFRVRSTEVVRSAVNRMVEGSNPSCPAKFAGLVQWQNGSLVSCASEVRFLCPAPEPTTWDPSAREPTLTCPHLPGLSPGFFISGSGNHHRHAYLLNRPEGLIPYYKQHPVFSEVIWLNVCKIKKALPECHG